MILLYRIIVRSLEIEIRLTVADVSICQQLCHCLNVSEATAPHSARCQSPLPPQLSAAPLHSLLNVCLVSTDDRAESNQSLLSPLISV